jgi:hypothetical protein
MPKVSLSQTSFTAGELDPRLAARHDYDGYYKGAETLTNVICLGQGGVARRSGMKYVDSVSSNGYRLVTFEFNTTQTYLLFFQHLKMYVYKDGVKQENFNGGSDDFIVTPFTSAQIREIGFTQSADTLIICHPSHNPQKIVRGSSHSTWTISAIVFKNQPTFDFDGGYEGKKYTPTFTSGGVNQHYLGNTMQIIQENIGNQSTTYNFANSTHLGGIIEFNGGLIRITNVSNSNVFEGTLLKEFLNADTTDGPDVNIENPVWTAARGYPSTVTFHESRLWFGNSTSKPQTLWASVIGDFFNFDRGVGADDDGIDITLDTDQVNAIHHIVSSRHLQIFTSGGEFYIPESPITPSNVRVPRQTRFGVLKNVAPITADGATMFIQRNGKQVREFNFTYTEASYVSSEVNLLAPHITNAPVAMASQTGDVNNEGNYIYVVNGDGTVGVFISNRAEKVMAWTKFVTDGTILDVAVVEDLIYFYVRRVVGSGDNAEFIEVLDPLYHTDNSIKINIGSTLTKTVSGLTHLNGISCRVRNNSYLLPDATPSSGVITLAIADFNLIEVGRNFDSTIKTMPANVNMPTGTNATKKKKISRVSLQLYESLGGEINNKKIPYVRLGQQNLANNPPAPFTGIKTLPLLGYTKTAQVTVTQTDPLDFTLLGLTIELQVTG